MSLVQLAIFVVIALAIAAIVVVAVRAFGLQVPGWVINILYIVVIAIVAIFAIRLVASM